MIPWLIVAGDFTPLGGMDAANYALARWLSASREVHVVAHRVWPDLAARPGVHVRQVRRPFGRHTLGAPLLARAGRRAWRELAGRGARAVVNGGNCAIADANWVHYLHAADAPALAAGRVRRLLAARTRRRDLDDERRALRMARVVICNSRRTRDDIVRHIGVDPERTRVVYYGSDPVRFALATPGERDDARRALGAGAGRRLAGFVGALGDRRKAFDIVFAAWSRLCGRPGWDVDLVVAGAGRELPAWRARARDAGLDGRIRFLGFRTDVPRVLAALDVFVHPARYEAYGLSVHEALCRGVPAIVSASAGVAEQYPAGAVGAPRPDVPTTRTSWRHACSTGAPIRTPGARASAGVSAALRARTWDAMAAEVAAAVEGAPA